MSTAVVSILKTYTKVTMTKGSIGQEEKIKDILGITPKHVCGPDCDWERLKQRMNAIPGIRNASITVRMPTENDALTSRVLTDSSPGIYPVRNQGYLVMDILKSRANSK